MPPESEIWIEFRGKRVTETNYGGDYPTDFRQLLFDYPPKTTGNILEWGSGLTTLIVQSLLDQLGARQFTSIENDPQFWESLSARITDPRVSLVLRDVIGPTSAQDDIGDNYTSYPVHACGTYDFIYVDGRRRLECLFVASLLSHRNTIVVMHDFRRSRYQAALALYEVLEDRRQFRVMKLYPEVYDALAVGRAATDAYFTDLYRRTFPRFAVRPEADQ